MSGVRENAGVKFEERSYKGNMLQITNKPRHFGSSLLWRLKKAIYRKLLKHPMVKLQFGRLDLMEWSFCNQTVCTSSFYLIDDALLYQNLYHLFYCFVWFIDCLDWKLANDCIPSFYMMKDPPAHTPKIIGMGNHTPVRDRIKNATPTSKKPGKFCATFMRAVHIYKFIIKSLLICNLHSFFWCFTIGPCICF